MVKSQATRSREQNRKIARRLLAEKLDFLENGRESREWVKGERERKRKRRKVKRGKRKYGKKEVGEGEDEGMQEGDKEREQEEEEEERVEMEWRALIKGK